MKPPIQTPPLERPRLNPFKYQAPALCLLLALCLLVALPAAHAARLALVIGNDTYTHVDTLQNARNDARLMAQTLREAQFEVTTLENQDSKNLFRALETFGKRVQSGDEVVFFFAGHGVQINNDAVLLPTDIRAESDKQVLREGLQLSDVQDALKDAKVSLLVIDACRDNPFPKQGTRSIGGTRGLIAPEVRGQAVILSAGRNQKALDRVPGGASNNGLFTHEFVKSIKGGLDLRAALVQVRDRVDDSAKRANHDQRPSVVDDLRGNFYFFAPVTIVNATPAAPSAPAVRLQSAEEIEQQVWDATQQASTAAAFNAYLTEYPRGRFAAAARVRLAGLMPAPAASITAQSSAPIFVKIGHAGPMTGGIAHLGLDNENGAMLAIQELNSRAVSIGGQRAIFQLISQDDGADPRKALAVAEYMVTNGVHGVVGHLNSGTSIPASAVYHRHGLPHISPSATNPRLTEQGFNTTFRLSTNDKRAGETLGEYAVKTLKAQRIAVITDKTAYGDGMAEAFARGVKQHEGLIVASETTNDKATDFTIILEKIKLKNPDLIFFGGMDSIAGPMLKQMKTFGLKGKFMGGDGICSEGLVKLAGDGMAEGQVICAESGGVTGAFRDTLNNFKSKFKAAFNADFQVFAPYTYDAVMVFASAMVAAGSQDPKRYLPYLTNINYNGVTGEIAFDARGDTKRGTLTLFTYKNGRRSEIDVIR